MIEHTTAGKMSLAELADGHKSQPSTILRLDKAFEVVAQITGQPVERLNT